METLLSTFNIHAVNICILLTIAAVFIIGLVLTKKNTQQNFISYVPTLLTTIGIFGTFLGIVLGLLHFDQDQIETSIPLLLAGLKTAFITSLVGMFASIIFKVLATLGILQPEQPEDPRYAVTPKDYLDAMQLQLQEIINLKKSFSGENEPSLSYQINSLRTDMNANSQLMTKHAELKAKLFEEKLDCLSETLAGMTLKTAIDDLNGILVHFNHSLTEQFGNKFKHFNEGLTQMLAWQQQHIAQYDHLQQVFNNASSSLERSENSLAQIAEHNESIFISNEAFKTFIEVTKGQIDHLEAHLTSFSELRDNAINAMPQMNQHLAETIDGLRETVSAINDYHQHLLTESSQIIQQHIDSSGEFMQQFVKETGIGIQNLKAANTYLVDDMEIVKQSLLQSSTALEARLTDVIEQAAQAQLQQANLVFQTMEQQISQQATTSTDAVNAQLQLIDDSMKREIQLVIGEMSKALAQISGQFVDDYTHLTHAMYRIINQHNNATSKAE